MVRQIILLAGVAGSGKDTVAKFFTEKGFIRLAFADILKERCSIKFNIDVNLFHTQSGKSSFVPNTGLSLRNLLINEASKQRYLDPDVFVNFIIHKIKCYDEDIVISDFRYFNEFSRIKDVFGSSCKITTIKVVRPYTDNEELSDHQLDYFMFDRIVTNDSTIQDLYKKLA